MGVLIYLVLTLLKCIVAESFNALPGTLLDRLPSLPNQVESFSHRLEWSFRESFLSLKVDKNSPWQRALGR